MNWGELNTIIIPAVIALGGGIVGYFLKYYLDKKAQFASNNAEVKRVAYQKFVNLTASFFIQSKKSQRLQNNAVEELGEFYKQYVLYGSPKVVRALASLMQVFYKRNSLGIADQDMTKAELRHILRSMTRVYKAMRKDIGLSNRTLGYRGSSLMRAIITDYDQIMRPKPIVWLSFYSMSLRNKWGRKDMVMSGTQEATSSVVLSTPEDVYTEDPATTHLQSSKVNHKNNKRKKR